MPLCSVLMPWQGFRTTYASFARVAWHLCISGKSSGHLGTKHIRAISIMMTAHHDASYILQSAMVNGKTDTVLVLVSHVMQGEEDSRRRQLPVGGRRQPGGGRRLAATPPGGAARRVWHWQVWSLKLLRRRVGGRAAAVAAASGTGSRRVLAAVAGTGSRRVP